MSFKQSKYWFGSLAMVPYANEVKCAEDPRADRIIKMFRCAKDAKDSLVINRERISYYMKQQKSASYKTWSSVDKREISGRMDCFRGHYHMDIRAFEVKHKDSNTGLTAGQFAVYDFLCQECNRTNIGTQTFIISKLCEKLGQSWKTLTNALKTLVSQGFIKIDPRVKGGRYRISIIVPDAKQPKQQLCLFEKRISKKTSFVAPMIVKPVREDDDHYEYADDILQGIKDAIASLS